MQGESLFSEFRPALRFLSVFIGVYLLGNVLYGLYVESFWPAPDPATVWVSHQTAFFLNQIDNDVSLVVNEGEPTVLLKNGSKTVLRIFEGCNGLNVMVVFGAFVLAFGGNLKRLWIFLFSGFFILHLSNLGRIILLFYTAMYRPHIFYYFHKYLFTAVLYCVVFCLWLIWTRMKLKNNAATS